ncbi:hypothetical protein ACJX0J_029359 [Zea mays]
MPYGLTFDHLGKLSNIPIWDLETPLARALGLAAFGPCSEVIPMSQIFQYQHMFIYSWLNLRLLLRPLSRGTALFLTLLVNSPKINRNITLQNYVAKILYDIILRR